MSADVIKDFLVSLGFKIDDAGMKKFTGEIQAATLTVAKLGVTLEATALAVVAFTTKISSGLEDVYFASQRTQSSVANIQALGFAASQMGSSAEAARGSLESLARFIRSSPGGEQFLKNLGIQTRDAKGQMRDTSLIMSDVGQRLKNMPYWRAKVYGDFLGIDEKTLMALRDGMGEFTASYRAMLKVTGFDSQQAAKSSHQFMVEMRSLNGLFGILTQKVGANLAGGLAKDLRQLRETILTNFPKIEKTITRVLKLILSLADAFTHLVFRAVQMVGDMISGWDKLDASTKDMLKTLGAVIAAWWALNSAFLASPVGLILTLVGALILLYDDYQTWKEGGKSLIDWSQWEKQIDEAIKGIKQLVTWLNNAAQEVGGWKTVMEVFLAFMVGKWLAGMLMAIGKVSGSVGGLAKNLASVAARNPWLLLFVPANNTPNQTEEMAELERLKQENARKNGAILPQYNDSPPGMSFGARGLRNNNPGNINFAGQAGATLEPMMPFWGGEDKRRFAKFPTMAAGFKALSDQLTRYYTGKTTGQRLDTIRKVLYTYAPPSDNNNTKAYVDNLAKSLGIGADAPLDLNNPELRARMISAITTIENGNNPYPLDYIKQAIGTGGSAGLPASVSQTTHITVHGATDPQATATAVGREQDGVNSRLIRNSQSKVQ
ncbi:lytic transglycosylase catalytic (plasmid) [Erwinia tracheiphila]|uniref:lytic transglycosylase catalytic n=1 Tax=Erwinia tracheiphila TaxID=65700 RepID=UPI001F242884|nr:lytic transglycosylase catalytic [Erwinia tracheiphila]UIA94541.1 lytic transglycosylase catalytic [Erwinia tracheiphila]